jgi:adhesin/invasin
MGPVIVESGVNAPSQIINAFNLGDGSLNLAVTSASASWLSATVGQSTTCSGGPVPVCDPINITLNTSGLAIGTYSANFTLNDPNAVDSPQTVNVTVQVDGSPTSATFYVTPNNGASTAQSDTASLVVNTGSPVISTVNTASGGSWLNFTLTGNHVTYNSYQLRVTAQPGQAEGSYSGTVVVSGSPNSADDKGINVTMNVTSQPILQIPSSPITFNLVQGQAPQTLDVTFQNIGLGTLAISGATVSNANWLSASSLGGLNVSLTANPAGLNPGSYSGTLTLASNAANTALPIPVQLNIAAVTGPVLGFGGAVDNAAFMTGLAAGSIGAVFGTQLTTSPPANAAGFPLPTALAGVQLLVNGSAVPLFYVGAGQINFQVPYELASGQIIVQETLNGQPSNRISASVNAIAPRLFVVGQNTPNGAPFGAVFNSDSTLALPTNLVPGSHPAHLGDVLTFYVLGLGPVSPPVATGTPAPTSPLAVTTSPVQVIYGGQGLGSVTTTAIYSGLAPSYAGLYQIDALLPQSAPTGNVPVSVSIQGLVSNVVYMAIASN